MSRDVQYYLAERSNQFPSVEVQQIYLRNYPLHDLAAQLFGTVGPINPQEYGHKGYKGVPRNAIIGQSGLEAAYDHYLRGTDGNEQVQVNAFGQPTGITSPHSRSPATSSRCRWTPVCKRSARARCSSRSAPTTPPTAARSWR